MKNQNEIIKQGISSLLPDLYRYLKESLNINQDISGIRFITKEDKEFDLFGEVLGPTGQYNPETKEIGIFFENRHPKDILRSFSHEMIHFKQDLDGSFSDDKMGYTGDGYAQKNGHLREMEMDAYLRGNILFRDWEDEIKNKNKKIYESVMSLSDGVLLKENDSLYAIQPEEEYIDSTNDGYTVQRLEDMRQSMISSGYADDMALIDFDDIFSEIIGDILYDSGFVLRSKEAGYAYDFSGTNSNITVLPFGHSGLITKTNKTGKSEESDIYVQLELSEYDKRELNVYGYNFKNTKDMIGFFNKLFNRKSSEAK